MDQLINYLTKLEQVQMLNIKLQSEIYRFSDYKWLKANMSTKIKQL